LSAIKIIFLIKLFKWKPKYSVNSPAIHFFLRSKNLEFELSPPGTKGQLQSLCSAIMGKTKDDYGHQPIMCKVMGKPFISWSFAEHTQHLLLVPKGYQRIASV
jgi:hypothetical protein